MKLVKILLTAAVLLTSASVFAEDVEKETYVSFTDVYVPKIVNPGENVVALLSGFFPNSCYRWKNGEVTHESTFKHTVKGLAAVSQGMCLMVIVPFNKEVDLGRLEQGHHVIRIVNGDGTYLEKELDI